MRLAQPDKSAQPALIGGRYRIEAPLGRGGAAQLYRVLDPSARPLALKLLHRDGHAMLRELFDLEYQTLASITHPRTPAVFEFGSDPQGVFYTMELLEGRDLGGLAPLPWPAVCEHVRDASQALGLLHARRLIHRDVSPRNLWRTPDGRVKLIDFGALAPFGVNAKIIGTPPLVAPEALAALALDQRADLYALGGVAYYLLTGQHAYPARTFAELQSLWGDDPVPPSRRVAQLARADLPAVPAELDRLVLALLSGDELARPSSTAEIIDAIDALCGTTSDSPREAAVARISNVAYVARARERRQLARRLALAARGRGQVCVIESAAGAGRSRVLRELAVSASVAQASVLHVNAAADGGMYGVASALASALLDAFPEPALAAAAPHAALLAHLSARVCERLGAVAAPASEVAGELRVQVQEAACKWFSALAEERALVVLVDGLEDADDSSVAFLLQLALNAADVRMLLVCALRQERAREHSAGVRALVKAARVLHLPPLRAAELQALLQSVFGQAEHLSRLSARLFELTRGNPGHALELCRELVERGAIGFEGGSWVLPRELDTQSLSPTRAQALNARLARVAGPARELARLLSVHDGPLSPGLCRALAVSCGSDLLPHLGELISAEILVPSGSNLVFAHAQFRPTCARELAADALRKARLALADHLMASPDAGSIERLHAGLHWLEADDPRGPPAVMQATLSILIHEVDKLASAASSFEAALILFRARGYSKYAEATLLTALASAGYEGELRYVLKYGEDAVRAVEGLFGLREARYWQRWVGGLVSLSIALGLAFVRFSVHRNDPLVPKFWTALQMLFMAVAMSGGAHALCLDCDGTARIAKAVEPFAALSPKHMGGFMNDMSQAILASSRDRHHDKLWRWRSLYLRKDEPSLREQATEAQVKRVRGGVLLGLGNLELFRDSPDALKLADELDQNGLLLDRMYADQIRAMHFGQRGDLTSWERYKQRAEHHAIARGTIWQVEIWSLCSTSVIALHLHDVLTMKTLSEQLRRIGEEIPSIVRHARYARGAYLVLHGKHAEAVPWLEDPLHEPPNLYMAWSRRLGVLASAYNGMGDYARADEVCERVHQHAAPEDFEYPNMNLVVDVERVIAKAGLGQRARAEELLAQLQARYGRCDNALLRGQVVEAALQIALNAGDFVAARAKLDHLEDIYQPLLIPSLTQFCEALAARVDGLEARVTGRPVLQPRAAARNDVEPSWSSDPLFATAMPLARAAERALQLLAASAGASLGALYIVDGGAAPRLCATLTPDAPSALIQRWVAERLEREREDERTALESEAGTARAPWNVMQEGGATYRLLVLLGGRSEVVAIAVLGRAGEAPGPCSRALLAAIGARLFEAIAEDKSEHTIRTG